MENNKTTYSEIYNNTESAYFNEYSEKLHATNTREEAMQVLAEMTQKIDANVKVFESQNEFGFAQTYLAKANDAKEQVMMLFNNIYK